MYQCPIEYFTDNLIVTTDKSCWAVYELHGFTYDMLSDAAKIGVLDRLTLFLANITSEAKITMIPLAQNIDRHFDALIEGLRPEDPLYKTAKSQANATRDYLKAVDAEKKRSNDYRTFITFLLRKPAEMETIYRLKDTLDYLFHMAKDFTAFMTADPGDISEEKIELWKQEARRTAQEQKRRLRLSPVKADTIQWMLRRMTYRGTNRAIPMFRKRKDVQWTPDADVVSMGGKKYLRPRKELVNLFSGEIRQKDRFLEITHEECETSWQTFLTITGLPEEHTFPGNEWIYRLQEQNYNAEICIHIRSIEHRDSLKKIDDQRRMANSQVDNIVEAGNQVPLDLGDSLADIETIEAELKVTKAPLLETGVVICLAGTKQEELQDIAQNVRRMYEDDRFTVERPLADQLALFFQCIPGVSFTVKDFIMRLTPRAVASGIFGATRELGCHVGSYVGTTGPEEKHVFEDFRRACLSNVSACAALYGNLGYGKSFNANLLLYLHVLNGAYGLVIDPKGERSHWPDSLTALAGQISLVTLTASPEFQGTLDPFNVFRGDINEACELALNLLAELFKIRPKDLEYVAILDALDRIKQEETPSMTKLAELLDAFGPEDDLKKPGAMLARQIRLQSTSGMARLIIGNGTEQAIRLDNRLNILQIQNMKLPAPETKKEDYSQEETVSSVLMMVITAFCRRFVHSHPNRFKMILMDESWFMTKTPEGEKLISYISRMSRSLYCSLLLNGHSVLDLPNEGVRNAITYKFMFHTDNTEEAKRMLEFMRLEPTPENIATLTGLENRQALYQDMNGRVGVLTFDAVFSDLIDTFSTTPTDEGAEAETAAAQKTGTAYA